MTNFLVVPIHLDALYLQSDEMVSNTFADFSGLPYYDNHSQRDVNADTAYIGQSISSHPLQDLTLNLKAGIHLHWSQPDTLVRGKHNDVTEFPPLPNRWLITRSRDNGLGQRDIEQQWVIESNRLRVPEGKGESGHVNYPVNNGPGKPPFSYLGNITPLSAWHEKDHLSDNPHFLHDFTAMGYGDPSFAAFYPNCRGVFGFHDTEALGDINTLCYEVTGWYADPRQDPLQRLHKTLGERPLSEAITDDLHWAIDIEKSVFAKKFGDAKGDRIWSMLQTSQIGWLEPTTTNRAKVVAKNKRKVAALPPGQQQQQQQIESLISPSKTLYYAQITFSPTASSTNDAKLSDDNIVIVGNTGTEALSAYLAHAIDKNHKERAEDQLESLLLVAQLQGRQLDIGPKFEEAQHQKGFFPQAGESRWTIRPLHNSHLPADSSQHSSPAILKLPDQIATDLHSVNDQQRFHDKAVQECEALRTQVYSDWHKYLVCAYPPEASHDDYPDMDELKYFIESQGIQKISSIEKEIRILDSTLTHHLSRLKHNIELHNVERLKFSAANVLDWAVLITRLPEQLPLWNSLPTSVQQSLSSTDTSSPPPYSDALDAFNALLVSDTLIDSFSGIPLSADAEHLKEKPQKSLLDTIRLNRLLILNAFPRVFATAEADIYQLEPALSPRYWQPTDPTILVTGSSVKPTERHGQDGRLRADGLLDCHLIDVDAFEQKPTETQLADIRTHIAALESISLADAIGFFHWDQPPWHPFMLEWEVEFFANKMGYEQSTGSNSYDTDYVTANYTLPTNSVDLEGNGQLNPKANVYSGRSILSPHANMHLAEQIEEYLARRIRADYRQQLLNTADSQRLDDIELDTAIINAAGITLIGTTATDLMEAFSQQGENLIRWYEHQEWRSTPAALETILAAYLHLQQPSFSSLSQALGGFNQALLMFEQSFNLPVADPLAFEDYQNFTRIIADTVGTASRRSPQALNDFNPIRAGAFRIVRLRLVDTFGQVKALIEPEHQPDVITSAPLTMKNAAQVKGFPSWRSSLVSLPPRFSQPARLNFRWLSASAGKTHTETNDHPATTPICGWILPNNIDESLMAYNRHGNAIGYIDRHCRWRPSPGVDGPTLVAPQQLEPSIVSNEHFRMVLQRLLDNGPSYLSHFIIALDSSLENIEPENFAQHSSLALLMGRPIAVVRAAINIELKGIPAVDQGWNALRQDMQNRHRSSNNYTAVNIPVRLGEHRQLNDGLVGYWTENNASKLSVNFYSPQTDILATDNHGIVSNTQGIPNLLLSLDRPSQNVTMLLDPRGSVHATSGVLPTKVIDLPAEQYFDALQSIEITFLSTPVITEAASIQLPLPQEAGFTWSWVERHEGGWAEFPRDQIENTSTKATFAGPNKIREGWLKLKPNRDETPS